MVGWLAPCLGVGLAGSGGVPAFLVACRLAGLLGGKRLEADKLAAWPDQSPTPTQANSPTIIPNRLIVHRWSHHPPNAAFPPPLMFTRCALPRHPALTRMPCRAITRSLQCIHRGAQCSTPFPFPCRPPPRPPTCAHNVITPTHAHHPHTTLPILGIVPAERPPLLLAMRHAFVARVRAPVPQVH